MIQLSDKPYFGVAINSGTHSNSCEEVQKCEKKAMKVTYARKSCVLWQQIPLAILFLEYGTSEVHPHFCVEISVHVSSG